MPRVSFANTPRPLQWLVLAAASAALAALLAIAHFPAALLIGTMLVAMAGGATDIKVRVPPRLFIMAHGLIGCMIAQSVRPGFAAELLKDWPLFAAVIVLAVIAACWLGWLLMKRNLLPGTTAVWGMSPGAAAAMVLMAESHGADMRLVAVMQYLRVVIVVLVSSVVARIWVGPTGGGHVPAPWFGPVAWGPLAATLAIAFGGSKLGQRLRIPAGSLLVPMAIAAPLQASGLLALELPRWLLAFAYAGLGWTVGLRFTREIVLHAARLLPTITVSMLALVAACAGIGALLTLVGIDPLTAYLATSPGGADSVAIIAASSNVDIPFVMGLQTARLMLLSLIGPSIARFMARLAARRRG